MWHTPGPVARGNPRHGGDHVGVTWWFRYERPTGVRAPRRAGSSHPRVTRWTVRRDRGREEGPPCRLPRPPVLELEASIAPAAPTVPVRPSTPAPPATAGWSARQRSTLTAVVSRMLDGAPLADARLAAVVSEVERRASRLAPHQQQELRQVLDLLDRRLVALASIGRPVPFVRATAAAQTRWLTAWSASPVPALRSAFQAFRRLALGVHYSDAAVTAAIGQLRARRVAARARRVRIRGRHHGARVRPRGARGACAPGER
jgi:hypothetical protein